MNIFVGQCRQHHLVQDPVLLGDQPMGATTDGAQLFGQRHLIGPGLAGAKGHLLLEASDANFEELVEVAARDAQELEPLKQWIAVVLGLFEHAPVKLQQAQLAIDVEFGVADRQRVRVQRRWGWSTLHGEQWVSRGAI